MSNYKVTIVKTAPKRRASHFYVAASDGASNEVRDEVFKRIRRLRGSSWSKGRFSVREDNSYNTVVSGEFSVPSEWETHGKIVVKFEDGERVEL